MNNLIFLKSFLGKHPNTTIKTWSNASGLTTRESDRLRRWGIVKNVGTTRNPIWKWNAGEPNDRMYQKVFSDKKIFRKKRSRPKTKEESMLSLMLKQNSVKFKVNNHISVEFNGKDDIIISRNGRQMKVENLKMLENILSLMS